LRATKPKITARIAPTPNTQTIPSTKEAMEKPFVDGTVGGAGA
jgi:hypothetical protein